jgi:hypothetical protein
MVVDRQGDVVGLHPLINQDVIDLYNRVENGAKVIVK